MLSLHVLCCMQVLPNREGLICRPAGRRRSRACHLPQSLDEWHGFNVAHCATQLDDADCWGAIAPIHSYMRHPLYPVLDGVCDVRHHLDGLPQVVPSPLTLDHGL